MQVYTSITIDPIVLYSSISDLIRHEMHHAPGNCNQPDSITIETAHHQTCLVISYN